MSAPLPLAGIRICDFTAVWAGQTATMYLADMGAECIKVENPYIWNPMTRAASPRITAALAQMLPPWIAGHPPEPGPRPWNNSPAFIQVLRNKKSFTVDSRRPEGLAIVQQLIRISDVVAENLALGTLEKLGLDDNAIRALRPDAVILHMPAFGRTGPYIEGRGYGSHIDAVAGGTILRGYRESAPADNVGIVPGDFWGGIHGAFAIMAALRHRRKTGQGQVIEMAQVESSAHMFPQSALDAAWNGRIHGSVGNRSIEGFAPNGVFPTATANQWIAISCRSDAEWMALCSFMGNPGWASQPELATAAGRAAKEDELEERLAEWTASGDRDALFHALQAAGVTAGPVLNSKEAAEDPHLAASRTWKRLPATEDYPEVDWLRPAYRFSESDVDLRTAPCLFGEHNDYVYRELLGLSEPEIDKLREAGHIADTFAPEALAEAMIPGAEATWVERDGVRLRVFHVGTGPTVLLLHGFPELAYSWRHQFEPLAEAGYRVVAPDQRGFGESDAPPNIEDYALKELSADAAATVDHFGAPAVVIGHDWGAPVAWHTALRFPERVRAVGSLSVPHARRAPAPPLELMRAAAGPDFIHYVDYFQEPGLAEGEFEDDVRSSLLGFLWSISGDAPREERFRPIERGKRFLDSLTTPRSLPPWLTEEDLQTYVRAFEASGFRGGLNWYRNANLKWERSADLADAVVSQPAMFVTGSRDPARNPGAIDRFREVVPDLRVFEVLEGCGHWTQQERPQEVNALLLEFLRSVDGGSRTM